MYKLYSIAGSCSTAITILMEKLNLNFEVIQRSEVANYQDIVLTNQVPALVCDDQIITEGAAVVLYLLEKHSTYLSDLNVGQRAKFYKMLMFNFATLHPAYSKIFTVSRISDNSDLELLQKLADKVTDLWQMVDSHLEKNEYMFGEHPTIIDYLLTIYVGWAKYFPELIIDVGDNSRRLALQISRTLEFTKACNRENLKIDKQLYIEG